MSLRVLLLGTPQILEGAIAPPTLKHLRRRERAALFLLAAHETPLARDRLLTYLWGEDADPVRAGKALSTTLSRIQRVLPEGVLHRHAGAYALQEDERLFVDYRRFSTICKRRLPLASRIPSEQRLPMHLAQTLKEAEKLWRGPFLEGCALGSSVLFEDWVSTTRQHLSTCYLNILNRLAYHAFLQQEHAEAFRLASLSLRQQPHQAEILLLALRALRQQRLTTQAEAFLEQQRAALREMWGEDFDAETLAEAHRLIRPHIATRPTTAPWRPRPTLHAPFVGHNGLLSRLVEQAQQGGAHLVLGASGQGKTRLLQEFATRLQTSHRLLSITCHYGERALPFAPLLEALRREVHPDEWKRVPQPWQPYLAHLFPEARAALPHTAPPVAPLQQHLMEATRQLLLLMSEHMPLAVCVDDAHWSDPATADTFLYWLERPPFQPETHRPARAFMLLTARSEALHESPLGKQLLPLRHENLLPTTELTGLSKDETAKLAEAMLGRTLSEEELDNLWRASVAGTPLYILEILRYQIEAGQAEAPVHTWPLSRHLGPLITQRLRYLTDDARRVLNYIALQESGVSFQLLARATGLPRQRLVHALEMLQETHWLQPTTEESPPTYRLMHAKLAEVLKANLSPAYRQDVHLRLAEAAEAIWQNGEGTHAAIIAEHYQRAGDIRRAFLHWIKAAHRALGLGIASQAHDAFRQAARLATTHTEHFADLDIWRLFAEWTLLAADTVDVTALEHITHLLQTLAEQRNSFLLRSSQLNAHAHLHRLHDRFDDALLMLQHAFDWLARAPETLLPQLELHTHYSLIASVRQHLQESWEHLTIGFALAQRIDDPLVGLYLGNLHYQRALSLIFAAQPHLAAEEATHSMEAFQSSKRVFGLADALAVRALARFLLGNFNAALQDCEQARSHGERFHKTRLLAYTYSYCALTLIAIGRLAKAWDYTQRALELSEHYRNTQGSVLALRARGDLFFTLEDWENAHAHYTEALLYSNQYTLEADVRFRAGETMARLGQIEAGLKMVHQGIKLQEALAGRPLPLTHLTEADILILAGRPREAKRILEGLRGHTTGQPGIEGAACLLKSQVALAEGRRGEAIEAARCAADRHAHIGHQFFHRWSLEMLQRLDALTPAERKTLKAIYRHLATFQNHPAFGASVRRLLETREEGLTS